MTETLTAAELVEASRSVLDAELPAPTGLEVDPLIERRKELQPHLASLGWFDLLTTPEKGGLGLAPSFAARLIRLSGSYLAPGPLIEQVLAVPWLLMQPGVSSTILDDSPGLAVATVDPGHDLPDRDDRRSVRLQADRVTGTTHCVLGAVDADVLLVHVMDTNVERLVAIPASDPGVHIVPLRGTDPCQSAGHVHFDCKIDRDQLIDADNELLASKFRAWSRLGTGEYLAGIVERVLRFGVDYAREREQFGRKIGSFQAVQHLLADVAVAARSLCNTMDLASAELPVVDNDEGVLIGVTAKARASTDAVFACETVLQVLGGIGFTVEHPLHHYFKRALSLAAQHGSPSELHLLAGRLVLAQNRGR